MFTILRRIRQKLIDSGSAGKYLLYAIGEILLVVIGILIALQVNNWNQERIESDQQAKTVDRLYSEFQSNHEELLHDITRLEDVINALESMISIIDAGEQQQFNEEEVITIITATANDPTWNPSSFVLDDMRNNGQISSLENEDLVDMIFSWERFYENVVEFQDGFVDANNQYVDHLTSLRLIVNISNAWGVTNSASAADITSIIYQDDQLYNLVHRKLIQAYFLNEEYQKTAQKLREIIEVAK